MFKRNKHQPYLLKGFKQIEAKAGLQEHQKNKQTWEISLPDPNPLLSASPNYHSSQFKGI